MTKVWVVRAGRDGEQEQANLDQNVATIGWNVGDLTQVQDREDVRGIIDAAFPDDSFGRRANFTGQIWAFRSQIQRGDIVVMPSKLRSGYLYLGKCGGSYTYKGDELNSRRRHQIRSSRMTCCTP